MANTSTLTANFTSGLPGWLSDTSTDGGSIAVTSGVLRLTTGTTTGGQGAVGTAGGDNSDSFYCRFYPMRTYALAVAYNWLDGSFNGYGYGVGTSSTTPGDAEVRVNRIIGGSLAHTDAIIYNETNHRWFRMRIDGSVIRFEHAPDSGTGPGTWTEQYNVAYGTDNPSWNPASVFMTMYNYAGNSDMYSVSYDVDGINTTTSAGGTSVPVFLHQLRMQGIS